MKCAYQLVGIFALVGDSREAGAGFPQDGCGGRAQGGGYRETALSAGSGGRGPGRAGGG